MRVILFIDADGDGWRIGSYLKEGIGNLPVEFAVLTGSDNI